MSQLQPHDLEIAQKVLDMILKYIGTIPVDENSEYRVEDQSVGIAKEFGSVPELKVPGEFLELELTETDPHAVSYVAGSAPNKWGELADGTTVS